MRRHGPVAPDNNPSTLSTCRTQESAKIITTLKLRNRILTISILKDEHFKSI